MTQYTMGARFQGKLYTQREMARLDEAGEVDAHGMKRTETTKAVIKATGLNPHLSVRGWPFCVSELDGDENEGGVI